MSRPRGTAALILGLGLLLVLPGGAQTRQPFPPKGYTAHYPKTRAYDIQHTRIELSIDLLQRRLAGKATLTLQALAPELSAVELDFGPMDVKGVTLASGEQLKHSHQNGKLTISLPQAARRGEAVTLTVVYEGTPQGGVRWVGPYPDYPERYQVWTQGQPESNHFWFPTWDNPDDKMTTETVLTVPERLTAVSNGRLVRVRRNRRDKTRTFHWKQTRPHSSYLVSFAVGDYELRRTTGSRLPIEYYVPRGRLAEADVSFARTPEMIQYFEKLIDRKYPWDKYGQVITYGHGGGMENTSITHLTERALHDERMALDRNWDSLIAHELAHQWFGDLLTCRSWAHAWLNEGFATYLDACFSGREGKDAYLERIRRNSFGALGMERRIKRPIVTHYWRVSFNMFDGHAYAKGAVVLHMLRRYMGDEAFWRGMDHYVDKHAYQNVETSDFRQAMEESSGVSLTEFFQQWVYSPGHPDFKLDWSYDAEKKQLTLKVEQTQKTDDGTPIFRVPVQVAVTAGGRTQIHSLNITQKTQTVSWPAPSEPQMLLFDAEHACLKTVVENKTAAQWRYQLEHGPDSWHRQNAVSALAPDLKQAENMGAMLGALDDQRRAVRQSVLGALLRAPVSDGPRDALLQAAADEDARIRRAAIRALLRYKSHPPTVALVREAAISDPAYGPRLSAVTVLLAWGLKDHRNVILKALADAGRSDQTRVIILRALARAKDADAHVALLRWAGPGSPVRTRAVALDELRRFGLGDRNTRRLLVTAAAHGMTAIRRPAIKSIRQRGEMEVIPRLEQLAASSALSDSVKKDLKACVKALRDAAQSSSQ